MVYTLSSAHWQQAVTLTTQPSAVCSFLMKNSAIQKLSMIIIIIIIITSSIQIPNETCNTIFISPWQYHVISYHWQKHDYFTMAMACFPYHHAMFMSPRHHHVYLIIATSCSSHYGNTMFICPCQHQCLPHHDNAILIAPGHIFLSPCLLHHDNTVFLPPWHHHVCLIIPRLC